MISARPSPSRACETANKIQFPPRLIIDRRVPLEFTARLRRPPYRASSPKPSHPHPAASSHPERASALSVPPTAFSPKLPTP